MERTQSQLPAAAGDRFNAASGIDSPNYTTPGRKGAPQPLHFGTAASSAPNTTIVAASLVEPDAKTKKGGLDIWAYIVARQLQL